MKYIELNDILIPLIAIGTLLCLIFGWRPWGVGPDALFIGFVISVVLVRLPLEKEAWK
jgi:hypothetical protein